MYSGFNVNDSGCCQENQKDVTFTHAHSFPFYDALNKCLCIVQDNSIKAILYLNVTLSCKKKKLLKL